MKRIRNLTLFFLGCLALVLVGGVLWMAHSRAMTLVHPGRTLPHRTPDALGITDWENVTFESTDGLRLAGWFIPPAEQPGATLIMVHGLGGNRGAMLSQAAFLAREGYGAFLIDLRNHGESEGAVTTLGYAEPRDVQGAVAYLATRPEVDSSRIGLIGESLGAAAVIRAAPDLPNIRLVIAQSAYTAIEDNIAAGVERLIGLPPFPFAPLIVWFGEQEAGISIRAVRPVDDVARIAPRPVMLMHGEYDDLFDRENVDQLYAAAGDPKMLVVVPDAGHGGLYDADPEGYAAAVLPFLAEHLR
jgi:fermentation-respiration switch protein FrsA (DUF1100 family)